MTELSIEFEVPRTGLLGGQGPKIVAEELVPALEYGVNLLKGEILPRVPVDRGNLRGAVQSRVYGEATSLIGQVFNPLGHALVMEKGRRPGSFPPVAPIESWARRKFGRSGLGFVIARSIAARGIKGRFFFKAGFEAGRPRVELRMRTALARITQRLAGHGA